jgi:hypothetical protein
MGILSRLYAHYKLNAMVSAWRRSRRLMDRVASFVMDNVDGTEAKEFQSAVVAMETVFDRIVTKVEDRVISEVKENI